MKLRGAGGAESWRRTANSFAKWLDIPIGRLDWLADVKGLTALEPS